MFPIKKLIITSKYWHRNINFLLFEIINMCVSERQKHVFENFLGVYICCRNIYIGNCHLKVFEHTWYQIYFSQLFPKVLIKRISYFVNTYMFGLLRCIPLATSNTNIWKFNTAAYFCQAEMYIINYINEHNKLTM